MFHTPTAKDNALHRLKIIRGHLDNIIKLVEEDAYCIDVLTQTKAVQKALGKVDQVLLKNHLTHCVVDHAKAGHAEKAIEEVIKVFDKS
jgi:DNA-binding FrmR family transcriptional regulator